METKQEKFIEKIGLFFEKSGRMPRIAGKIFAYLLICDPSKQTAKQIYDSLNITKSSFSSNISLLIQKSAIIESTRLGERSKYYELKIDGWEELFLKGLKRITTVRHIFSEGKAIVKNKNPQIKKRLNEIDKLYHFFEIEIPNLIKKWKKYK